MAWHPFDHPRPHSPNASYEYTLMLPDGTLERRDRRITYSARMLAFVASTAPSATSAGGLAPPTRDRTGGPGRATTWCPSGVAAPGCGPGNGMSRRTASSLRCRAGRI